MPNRRASMSTCLALHDAMRNGHRTSPAMASILTTVFVVCGLLITLSSSNEAGWNSRLHARQCGQVFLSTVDKTDSMTRTHNLLQSAQQVVDAECTVTSNVIANGMAWNSGPGGPETMVEAVNPIDKSTLTMRNDMGTMAEIDIVYIVDDGTHLRGTGYLSEGEMVRAIVTLNTRGVPVPDPRLVNGAGQTDLRSLDMPAIAAAKAAGTSDDDLPDALVQRTMTFPASPLTHINVMVLFPQASGALGLRAVPLGELLTVEKPVNLVDTPAFQTTIACQVPGASAQVIAPMMRSLVLPYVAALTAVVAATATVVLMVALSSSGMRPDLDTLDAIGAVPSMRRRVTTWQGVVLALNVIPTVVLSGLVVGVLAVITFADSRIFPTLTMTLCSIIPWGALLGMLIGMPILCTLVTIILMPRHQKRIHRINWVVAMSEIPEEVVIPAGALALSAVHVDTWLWATRQPKSRSQATTAVRTGHVRINSEPVKATYKVRVGDEVRLRIEGFGRILGVNPLLNKRISYSQARIAYDDRTPERPRVHIPVVMREKGSGRPTKKE